MAEPRRPRFDGRSPTVLPQIEAVLAALVRVGGRVTSPDGGRGFLPRRAA
jgi:hypothetical protein